MDKPWKLTEQELAECDAKDQSRFVVQEAKKRAYIEAGGVILNPDALEDMYEALKEIEELMATKFDIYEDFEKASKPVFLKMNKALAKAEGS